MDTKIQFDAKNAKDIYLPSVVSMQDSGYALCVMCGIPFLLSSCYPRYLSKLPLELKTEAGAR